MSSSDIQITGRREERAGATYLVWERTFAQSPEQVWAAVTEPARLARWIGTWEGDPGDGAVDFRMTAEGEDCPTERYRILACDPPRRLVVESGDGPVWHLELDVVETPAGADHGPRLVFGQRIDDPAGAESIGPGWEYYLDRLVAAESGTDVAAIDFDDYYPAQAQAYRDLFV